MGNLVYSTTSLVPGASEDVAPIKAALDELKALINGNLDQVNLAANAVGTIEIADQAVTTAKLADLNVTTAKLADANVTTAKIADANVTTAKIANDAITAALIAVGAVGASEIADGSVGTAELADGAVTPVKRGTAVQGHTQTSGLMTTPASTAEVNCLNVAVTTTGRPVLVMWGCIAANANSGANRAVGARCRLDGGSAIGVEKGVDLLLWSGALSRHYVGGHAITTPAAGSHTFGLYVNVADAGTCSFYDGEITVVEL